MVSSLCGAAKAADFEVTTPGFFYAFNGGGEQNPGVTLVRGRTYTFHINAEADHPFFIFPEDGVQNNNISQGTITFHVPQDAANDNFMYICSIHGFGNLFSFVDPPAPPIIRIVGLSVSNQLVLTSTGTNNWSVLPEFKTNLVSTNWFALTVQTNRFFNGTNETICGRPAGNAVFIRIRSQPN